MSTFSDLQETISKRKKAEFDSSVLLKLNIINNDIEETTIEKNSIFYSYINKDIYDFRIYVVSKKTPEKIKDSTNHLDYNMNEYYFLNIEVNDDKNICEFTLNKYNKLIDARDNFNKIFDIIKNSELENIFNFLANVTKEQI